jgi:hypothetical protein
MRPVAIVVAASGLLASGLLVLTGCSAFPSGFASPSPTASASPSSSPVPIGPAFGDVAPRESVTDEIGTYLHITLAPDSAAATEVDPGTVGSSIAGSSWDDDGLLAAQRFVATYVAEQTIDSIALDRDQRGWDIWLVDIAARYFGPGANEDLAGPGDGSDRATPIFNDPDDFTPRLVRDGLPRMDDATITIDSLENMPREGGEWLVVTGTSDVAYRLNDDEARSALAQQGFDQETINGFPALTDGVDGHYLVHLEWSYAVERTNDAWVIRDYDLIWDANIEGAAQA